MRRLGVSLFVVALVWTMIAPAGEITQVAVSRDEQTFTAEAVFTVDAPREAVFRAFTAFDRLADLNPAILSSRAVAVSDGLLRVTTRVRDCIALFCRTVALVEDVTVDRQHRVQAKIVPELSDFHAGETTWRFEAMGQRTRIRYRSRMRPGFWLPPLLGTRALRRALTQQVATATEELESTTVDR